MENIHEAQGSHSQGPTQNLQALRMFRHRKGLGSQNQDFQKHLASAKEWRNKESWTEWIHFHWSRQGRSKDSCWDERPGRDLGSVSDGVLWVLSPPHPLLLSSVLLPQSLKYLTLHSEATFEGHSVRNKRQQLLGLKEHSTTWEEISGAFPSTSVSRTHPRQCCTLRAQRGQEGFSQWCGLT